MNFNFNVYFIKLLGGFSVVGLVTTLFSLVLVYYFLKLYRHHLLLLISEYI